MEKQPGKLKMGGIPLTAGAKSVPTNENSPLEIILFLEQKLHLLALSCILANNDPTKQYQDGWSHTARRHSLANKTHLSHYGQLLETPNSPGSAMEFLCRSWSPSASSFLQMFSSSDLLIPTSDSNSIEDQKEWEEKRNTLLTINNSRKMDLNQGKGWLKGKPLTSFFRSCKEKKKEEIRFNTANLHAALSLTKLAAAIAGFASSTNDINHKNNIEATALYEGMERVAATAATLITTVCAEAAESLGADRSQVASAVNSGLAISTPTDMMAVTATAATCLRGSAILKSRMMADSFPGVQKTIRVRSQICIITPSGIKEYKYVTMYSKHRYVIICFQKKYFGGTLTTSKEYKVFSIEETMDGEGYFFLSLKTNNGTIKLLFEDEKQLGIWISTTSNLLKMHAPVIS